MTGYIFTAKIWRNPIVSVTMLGVFLKTIQEFNIQGQKQSERTTTAMLCGHFLTFSPTFLMWKRLRIAIKLRTPCIS
jgi:hypothetical protein